MVPQSIQNHTTDGGNLVGRSNSDIEPNPSGNSRKRRLRWTQELRDRFEEVVNQLGGADRATPKGILKAMDLPGLTIYHVKSHLQKYRISKFIPESFDRARFERRKVSEILPNFSVTAGVQINEAIQMQMEMQRQLYDQLEVQRHLRYRIEAQRKYLEKIVEEHHSLCIDAGAHGHSSPTFTSLSEESQPKARGFLSDSEVDGFKQEKFERGRETFGQVDHSTKLSEEMTEYEGTPAHKRVRVATKIFWPDLKVQSNQSECEQRMILNPFLHPKEAEFSYSNHGSGRASLVTSSGSASFQTLGTKSHDQNIARISEILHQNQIETAPSLHTRQLGTCSEALSNFTIDPMQSFWDSPTVNTSFDAFSLSCGSSMF